jgi:hypothetical protein
MEEIIDYGTNPFGTHRPCLVNLIKNTSGNIIEFGCGDSSTTLIKKLINNTDRKLYTIESNETWLNKYRNLEDINHKFHFVDAGNNDNDETAQKWIDYIENTEIKDVEFDIVFIDSSPWTSRTYLLNYYKNKSKYIIVHDVGYFPNSKLWGKVNKHITSGKYNLYDMDFSDIANSYHVFYPYIEYFALNCGPATLLLSNKTSKEEFNTMIDNIYSNNKYYNKDYLNIT